jgi:hypothetical protein
MPHAKKKRQEYVGKHELDNRLTTFTFRQEKHFHEKCTVFAYEFQASLSGLSTIYQLIVHEIMIVKNQLTKQAISS